MLRVGLTGGIACGKSHVLARLASRGVPTLDLDRVAREVVAPGEAGFSAVVGAFGAGVLAADGAIDRKRLGAIVFADASARQRLNAIVHPRVRDEEERRARALAEQGAALLVTDAALLVEGGLHLRFDRLVVVHCPAGEQVRRLMARDGLEEAAAHARLEAQMPIDEKRRFAHVEVDTSDPLAETERAADRLAVELFALAQTRPRPVAPSPALVAGILARGPRGIDPGRLHEAITRSGGLEMESVARLLSPPASGPWFRAALASEDAFAPEAFAGPLCLWALSRAGDDREFLVAAAASLARLTHRDADRIAGACFVALGLQAAIAVPQGAGDQGAIRALAERWGGGAVPEPLVAGLADSLDKLLGAGHD